jgi:alpha-beta hydrolase superfamily lysophospholipase
MQESTFTLDRGAAQVFVYRWLPDAGVTPRGVVQISHGMAEHAARYRRFAEALTAAGFAVYAHDHRGHGRTAGDVSKRGHFADHDGWRAVLDDLYAVTTRAADEHPGVACVLFAHSMGSFMAQQAMFERASLWKGVALSASTSGVANPLAPIGRVIARVERLRVGASRPSKLLTKLSFGEFNKGFRPARTEYDWLSRDPGEVDKYIADEWCGFDVSTQLWIDLLDALPTLADTNNLARVPKDLPVYVLAGTRDPVTGNLKGLQQLVDAYQAVGLRDITWKTYEGGRHEMLNETNRADVERDFITWLERFAPAKAS